MLRIASLGSGSKGNSTLIDDGETRILIDLGFGLKEAKRRLSRLSIDPNDIDAILVTHEHADHVHGVGAFARKYGTAVYLTPGTYVLKKLGQLPALHKINCHLPFSINGYNIVPVAVPHDAKEPCQYVVNSGTYTVGILTDLGHITPHVATSYQQCDALLLECNHDLEMLSVGPYPYPLKQRVGGEYGHLNNLQAAGLLTEIDLDRLKHLIISHISEQNNQAVLARQAVEPALSGWSGTLLVAEQQLGFDWIYLEE